MTLPEQFNQLHTCYQHVAGLTIKWNMEVERLWWEWWKEGYREQDLKLVIGYVKEFYKDNPKVKTACLRFHKLIGDTLFFAEHLAEAKARGRVKEPTPKQVFLQSIGKSEPEKSTPAKSIRTVLDSKEFKEFVDLKKRL